MPFFIFGAPPPSAARFIAYSRSIALIAATRLRFFGSFVGNFFLSAA